MSTITVGIDLPTNLGPGQIIGKGGCNTRRLTQLSGASITVSANGARHMAKLRGSAASVAKARELLQQFVNHLLRTSGPFCTVLIGTAFPESSNIRLQLRNDDISRYMWESGEPMFVLVPAPQRQPTDDDVADALANIGLDQPVLYGAALGHVAVQRMTDAARDASILGSHGFDELKLRFNFGKLFCFRVASRYLDVPLTQTQLKAMVGRRDVKVRYSNAVPRAAADQLVESLEGLGFQLVEQKHSLSVHLGDDMAVADVQLALSFDRGYEERPSTSLSLRKVKTAASRLFYMTSAGHGMEDLDCRFKLVGLDHMAEDSGVGQRLKAAAARFDFSGDGTHPADLHIGSLQDLGLVCRTCRFKSKKVYQGSVVAGQASVTLRLSVVDVNSTLGDAALEVTGTCIQLNAALEALRTGGAAQHVERVAQLLGQTMEAVRQITHPA